MPSSSDSRELIMSVEAYSDMVERMKLTIELIEADRNLKTMPSVPADEVFSDLRKMIGVRDNSLRDDSRER